MVNLIVDKIVTELRLDLPWIEKITGIVKPASIQVGDTVKTLPVAVNTDVTKCNDSELLDFVPDSRKKSIVYFEDRGSSVTGMENQYIIFTARFTLVCWFNYKTVGDCLTNPSLIAGNLIKYVPMFMGNIEPLIGVVVSMDGQQPNDGRVFSKYTYIEEVTQFITYPYGYVALDFEAEFRVRKECIRDLTECVQC